MYEEETIEIFDPSEVVIKASDEAPILADNDIEAFSEVSADVLSLDDFEDIDKDLNVALF